MSFLAHSISCGHAALPKLFAQRSNSCLVVSTDRLCLSNGTAFISATHDSVPIIFDALTSDAFKFGAASRFRATPSIAGAGAGAGAAAIAILPLGGATVRAEAPLADAIDSGAGADAGAGEGGAGAAAAMGAGATTSAASVATAGFGRSMICSRLAGLDRTGDDFAATTGAEILELSAAFARGSAAAAGAGAGAAAGAEAEAGAGAGTEADAISTAFFSGSA
jgi:hypothetical protein